MIVDFESPSFHPTAKMTGKKRPLEGCSVSSNEILENNDKESAIQQDAILASLQNWVMKYFGMSDAASTVSAPKAFRPPLYFQKDGHSITIIGQYSFHF